MYSWTFAKLSWIYIWLDNRFITEGLSLVFLDQYIRLSKALQKRQFLKKGFVSSRLIVRTYYILYTVYCILYTYVVWSWIARFYPKIIYVSFLHDRVFKLTVLQHAVLYRITWPWSVCAETCYAYSKAAAVVHVWCTELACFNCLENVTVEIQRDRFN